MNIINVARVLALLFAAFFSALVNASVGKVIVSVGQVEAETPRGEVRALKRRAEIFESDTVKTYQGAKTQMRFSDGSMLALGENTVFKVDEYEYDSGDPEKAAYQLLKGSMQTITGAIGKTNKKDYSLKTPVATIGIRGTYFQLRLTPSGGLVGGVKDGAIVIENRSGAKSRVSAGEFFEMASATADIEILEEPPAGLEVVDQAGAAADTETDRSQSTSLQDEGVEVSSDYEEAAEPADDQSEPLGVNTDPGSLDESAGGSSTAAEGQDAGGLPGGGGAGPPQSGRLDITPTGVQVPAGNGVALAFIHNDIINGLESSADAFVSDANNQIFLSEIDGAINTPTYLEIQDPDGGTCNVCQFSNGTGTLVEEDFDETLEANWGRWSGGVVLGENGVELDAVGPNVHFIYSDNLTPYAQLAGLTGTIRFNSLGGTNPTDSLGNVGTLQSMSVDVDFDALQFIGVDIQVTAGGTGFNGSLLNPVDISDTLTTQLLLDNGRLEAQFVGQGPGDGVPFGLVTGYELQDANSGKSVVGTNLLSNF